MANVLGTARLTAYAWNGTGSGTPNLTLHGKTGGTMAFSATTLTATCLVDTAPTPTSRFAGFHDRYWAPLAEWRAA